MSSKVYTEKGNCVRGARTALKNKAAMPGVDFMVVAVPGGFSWSVSGAAKATRVRKPRGGPKPSILGQPQAMKAIALCSQKGGITVANLAVALGGVTVDTARGLISRCNQALRDAKLPEVSKGKAFKTVVYTRSASTSLAPALAAA